MIIFKTFLYCSKIGFEKFSKIINLLPVVLAGQYSSSTLQASAGHNSNPLLVSTCTAYRNWLPTNSVRIIVSVLVYVFL